MGLLKLLKVKLSSFKNEFSSHTTFYILFTAILFLALFVRIYRVGDLTGFYYDQGRDALVIWKFWHEGKFFLVLPCVRTCGNFFGSVLLLFDSTVLPTWKWRPTLSDSVFVNAHRAGASDFVLPGSEDAIKSYRVYRPYNWILFLLFSLVRKVAFQPNPNVSNLYFTTVGYVPEIVSEKREVGIKNYELRKIQKKLNLLWLSISFLVGISLQLESASAVFYIPMVLVFAFLAERESTRYQNFVTMCIFILANPITSNPF